LDIFEGLVAAFGNPLQLQGKSSRKRQGQPDFENQISVRKKM